MNPVSKLEQLTSFQNSLASSIARDRLTALFDADSFVELDAFGAGGVVTATGTVAQSPVYAYAQDPQAQGGAIHTANARKLSRLYELAAKTGAPVVAILDSKGAAVGEGAEMLTAYSDLLYHANRLSGVVPQLTLVVGTCAGAMALLAAGSDVLIVAKEGEIFLNPPYITGQTEDAPDAGTADFAAKSGVSALTAETPEEGIALLKKLLGYLPQNNLGVPVVYEAAPSAKPLTDTAAEMTLKELARGIADASDLLELFADYGENTLTAFAALGGMPVGIAGAGGALGKKDCDKLTRFVRLCDAYSVPIITLLDTPGFAVTSCPGLMKAASRLSNAYAEATTVKLTLVAGQAVGAAYLALASRNAGADLIYAWPGAVISGLPVETAVEFTLHEKLRGVDDLEQARQQLSEEYIDTVASPFAAAKIGLLDGVLAPSETRAALLRGLEALLDKRSDTLPKKHANTVF